MEAPTPSSSTGAIRSESGPEVILVVDDQPQVNRIVGTLLRSAGYWVLTVDSPAEAVQIGRENKEIRLLITDIEMPDISGDELAAWFRISRPDVQILFMSGNPAHRNRLEGEGAPFIDKPFRPFGRLLETTRDLLAKGRTNRPAPTLAA